MRFLRQAMAASVTIGPLLDSADGVTAVSDPTLEDIGAQRIKADQSVADLELTAEGGDNDFAHLGDGHFSLELTAADTADVGPLRVTLAEDSGAFLPVWADFEVLPAETYDVLFSATGPAVTGAATTIWGKIEQLWRRFFKKATMTTGELKTYADNGADVLTTQALSDDGTTQTQGPAA